MPSTCLKCFNLSLFFVEVWLTEIEGRIFLLWCCGLVKTLLVFSIIMAKMMNWIPHFTLKVHPGNIMQTISSFFGGRKQKITEKQLESWRLCGRELLWWNVCSFKWCEVMSVTSSSTNAELSARRPDVRRKLHVGVRRLYCVTNLYRYLEDSFQITSHFNQNTNLYIFTLNDLISQIYQDTKLLHMTTTTKHFRPTTHTHTLQECLNLDFYNCNLWDYSFQLIIWCFK